MLSSPVRIGAVTACVALLLGAGVSPALAAKKKKKKGLGAVVTRTAVSGQAQTTGQLVTATALCPGSKVAFGGGFASIPTSSSLMFIHESRRSGSQGWKVSGTFFGLTGTPTPLSVTSIVHCRRLAKDPKEVAVAVPVVAMSNTTPATAIARCQGSKQKLLSGGFQYDPPASGNVHQALVYENQPAGKNWVVSVQNSGNSPARTLTGYAYCAKGLTKAAKISTGTTAFNVPVSLGQISATSAGCPAKTSLSGGGYVSPFPATAPMTARPLYFESQSTGTAWRASAMAGFGPGPLSITALGICT